MVLCVVLPVVWCGVVWSCLVWMCVCVQGASTSKAKAGEDLQDDSRGHQPSAPDTRSGCLELAKPSATGVPHTFTACAQATSDNHGNPGIPTSAVPGKGRQECPKVRYMLPAVIQVCLPCSPLQRVGLLADA
jgi:hypothetical protein